MTFKNPSDLVIQDYLKNAKNIAVVGLSDKEDRTSHEIARILQNQGYRIFPVNPVLAGKQILGETVYASIKDISEPIDIVDIFRRSEFLPEIAEEFVETDAKVFWAQLGLESEKAADILAQHHRDAVVMNRCIKIELAK
ncbi:CoA-binding protein [Vagococcus silagei]|uniref:CoA-binding protein n=1 Tax=Vagococcus silagei TaxID=2508885 RepID=A0A4S3B300_9ENTE|nr:CoA-binding protein [Vagococcus silagei]THB61514.1 CoA-binding protein [Vagococcus silagei]